MRLPIIDRGKQRLRVRDWISETDANLPFPALKIFIPVISVILGLSVLFWVYRCIRRQRMRNAFKKRSAIPKIELRPEPRFEIDGNAQEGEHLITPYHLPVNRSQSDHESSSRHNPSAHPSYTHQTSSSHPPASHLDPPLNRPPQHGDHHPRTSCRHDEEHSLTLPLDYPPRSDGGYGSERGYNSAPPAYSQLSDHGDAAR
ncbi:uncharacterized protein I303_108262 [Kwoniella dejecticola CBS 10117]|uniref:Uncharacterized protein n=1 Tax=Kwoniella dejecticola CBS 10117 TaxID=1296121 RepID=A0A1A5ZXY1_9TREE|nr:uncharacterized protein I303_07411 [Kwoniella dejecticola CBS 10117]OBR82648.1 hypothetical protein I303_07411 [Kwoniella dejecticola CBS 10117]